MVADCGIRMCGNVWHRTNGKATTWMRSEHGNSLHFISSAVHFLYKNFPKKSIFSTTTSPKSRFSLHKHPPKKPFFGKILKKSLPKTQGPPPRGLGRRADPPTGADRAIPKPGSGGQTGGYQAGRLAIYLQATCLAHFSPHDYDLFLDE